MSGGSGRGQLLVPCVVNFSLNASSKILCHLLYSETTAREFLHFIFARLCAISCARLCYGDILCWMQVFSDDRESRLAEKDDSAKLVHFVVTPAKHQAAVDDICGVLLCLYI